MLAEVCYFLETRVGPVAEAQFLRSIVAGELELVELESLDLERMAELVTIYADFPLGAVDASVIALAERLGGSVLMTTARRDDVDTQRVSLRVRGRFRVDGRR